MGFEPRMPYEWLNELTSPVYDDDPIKIRLNNFKFIHKQLTKNLEEAQLQMVERHNEKLKPKTYSYGDLVYVKNPVRSGINYKLASKFKGPYKVIEDCNTKLKIRKNNDEEWYMSKDKVKKINPPSVTAEMEDNNSVEEIRTKTKRVSFNKKVEIRRFTSSDVPSTHERYSLKNQR